jgi:hypothetical protein
VGRCWVVAVGGIAIALVERAIEFPQQIEQLRLLFSRQCGELIDNPILVTRYDRVKELAALVGRKESIAASILLPQNEATTLHPVQELTHIAFGHQQCVCQFLLGHSLTGADMCQHIKLCQAQSPAPHLVGGSSIDFCKNSRQAEPGQQCRSAQTDSSGVITRCCTGVHTHSLAVNSLRCHSMSPGPRPIVAPLSGSVNKLRVM